jgi:phosphosulfolactate synthase (CoM biosynthesis protein A)
VELKICHFELNLPSSEIQMNEKDKMSAEEIVKHLENMIKNGMKLLVTDARVIGNILTIMEKENGAVFENEVELPNGINSPREGASKPSSKRFFHLIAS